MTDNLWNAKRCAEFIGIHYDTFRKQLKKEPHLFPPPLDKPGRYRWHPEDWLNWAASLRKNTLSGN